MSDFYQPIATIILDFFSVSISDGDLLSILISFTILLFILFFFTLVRLFALKTELKKIKPKIFLADEKINTAEQRNIRQQIRAAKLLTLLKNERRHSAEKLTLLINAREELSMQFSNLAQQILEEKSARFSDLNKEKLESILHPFNQQLVSFKQDINEIYLSDTRERVSLKKEIVQLRDLNQQISQVDAYVFYKGSRMLVRITEIKSR